ncbi:MAG: hypothetical protein IT323_02080 [Anaerolineae bacterium]|nr:hypothetical protein [Anaerolineae bacterium]
MPFFDDSGVCVEEERTALERTFALAREQLERLITLNLLWALQGVPLLIAWAFPTPDAVRVILTFYSVLAIPPATATMYAMLARVCAGEPIDRHQLTDCAKGHALNGLLKLMPLYSLFFWLALLMNAATTGGWLALDVLARLLFLLLATLSLYWGPALAAHPEWSLVELVTRAARLFWRSPGQTLLLGGACLIATLLGVISIAGLVLIVPVLIILLQTEFYRSVTIATS